jgi:hypothetical protein
MYVHVCTCMYMYVHVCTCMYMYVHVCTCIFNNYSPQLGVNIGEYSPNFHQYSPSVRSISCLL